MDHSVISWLPLQQLKGHEDPDSVFKLVLSRCWDQILYTEQMCLIQLRAAYIDTELLLSVLLSLR